MDTSFTLKVGCPVCRGGYEQFVILANLKVCTGVAEHLVSEGQ